MSTDSSIYSGLNGAVEQATQNQNQQPKDKGQSNISDIAKLIRNFKTTATISDGGREYLTKLKDIIAANDKSIQVDTLTTPPGSFAIRKSEQCFIMLFSEVLMNNQGIVDDNPVTSYTKSARTTVWALYGNNVNILNVVVITPEDYHKVEIMANYIINSFIAVLDQEIGTINCQMFKDYTIQTSSSAEQYDRFVRMYSPHGVPARADMKLTIYGVKNGSMSQNNKNFWNESDQDRIDIASVGAYVTFSTVDSMNNRFIPEIHISEIISNIPIRNLISFILGVASSVFMDTGYWKNLFHDLGPNQPNIGNLFTNYNDGSVYRVTNLPEVESLMATYVNQPIVVIDIPDGRARIIGLEQYATNPGPNNTAIASANAFFNAGKDGNYTISSATNTHTPSYYQYDGYIRKGGENIDSRWVDYLNMMIHHSATPTKCQLLLSHCINPVDHVKRLREFGEDLTLLYMTTYSIINPVFLRDIQKAINSNMRINITNVQAGFLSSANFLNASQLYAQNSAILGGNVGGYQNPFVAAQFWMNK